MTTYSLYIGANNNTKRVERDKLLSTLDEMVEGYTVTPAIGRWNGVTEESVVVLLTIEPSSLTTIVNKLKYVLKQQAIAYKPEAELEFI